MEKTAPTGSPRGPVEGRGTVAIAKDVPAGVVLPEVDFEIERLTVVVLFEGPRRADYAPAEAQRLANEHVQYVIGLAQAGHILHAGALIDPDPAQHLTGLGFSSLPPDELRPLIAQDPAIMAGMEAFKLVTYSFPKGGLAFPRAAARSRQRDGAAS